MKCSCEGVLLQNTCNFNILANSFEAAGRSVDPSVHHQVAGILIGLLREGGARELLGFSAQCNLAAAVCASTRV